MLKIVLFDLLTVYLNLYLSEFIMLPAVTPAARLVRLACSAAGWWHDMRSIRKQLFGARFRSLYCHSVLLWPFLWDVSCCCYTAGRIP
jgi:hypothetical protein